MAEVVLTSSSDHINVTASGNVPGRSDVCVTSSPSPSIPRVIYAGSLYVTVNRQDLEELLRWVVFAEKLLAELSSESGVGVRVCHR